MTAQKKLILKIVIVMILIVGAPILYFLSIGQNSLSSGANDKKQIAVVNEDTGVLKQESALDFGKEVVPILSTDSSYEWSVVSRSTAEKGLADQVYDAIVYIPSNFSQNIMTYEEQQPEKAEFKYTVSGQLNTANREKVLREIDNASTRVNGKISTLYWSYVSQDLEKVRQEFDSILQKEMEFLETISEYYSPDIASVVGDINRQKDMLASLSNSLNSVPIDGNVERSEEFQTNLAQFVTYVNQYKDYQTTQQQLLQKLQGDNFTAVKDMKNGYGLTFTNKLTYLEEQNEKLIKNLQALQGQMATNVQNVSDLSNLAVQQRDEILSLLMKVEGDLLVQYETEVIDLRNQLSASESVEEPIEDPTPQATKSSDNEQMKRDATNFVALSKIAALDTEREKLLGLVQQISSFKDQLADKSVIASQNEVTPEEGIEDVTTSFSEAMKNDVSDQLNQLVQQISIIEKTIEQIQQEEKQLQKDFVQQTQPQVNDKVEEKEEPASEMDYSLTGQIERRETTILDYKPLNNEKKERLKKFFNKPLKSDNTDLLVDYYGALAQYETALKTSVSRGSKYQELASNVNKILGITEDSNSYLEQLQAGVPNSQKQLDTLGNNIQTFFTEYLENLNSEYEGITKQLDNVEKSAGQVQESLDVLMAGSPGASQVTDGNSLVSNHESISQSLQSMSDSMNNIAKSQQTILSETEAIHSKTANVNADTSDLVYKWNENVGTTKKYRDDIHNVLNNAFVDGQKNGQIYEHLSTPLSVNSLDEAVQEDRMPPVIVLVIVMISGLLIGYFCYYFKNKTNVRIALFVLLNLIVGIIISLYGLDIYGLDGTVAIQWTIFTTLLLAAVSSVIFAGFTLGHLVGWFANVAVIGLFVTPMLSLLVSNINYEDPMSKVYLSIQYGPDSLIIPGSIVLILFIGLAAAMPYLVKRMKNRVDDNEDTTYEV